MRWHWVTLVIIIALFTTIVVATVVKSHFAHRTRAAEGYAPYLSDLKSSIVIPCIMEDVPNLDNLLKTIQEQTIKPMEIIIALSSVGATDELNKRLQTIVDIPLTILGTEEKCYAGVNRNRGADASKGDYILFMDADDLMHPQCVEIILRTFVDKDPIAVVHGFVKTQGNLPRVISKYNTFDGNYLYNVHIKNPPKDNTLIGLPHKNLHQGHISVKRKVFQDGIRYTNRVRGQDAQFLRKLLDHYSYLGAKNVNYVDAKLTVYLRRITIPNYGLANKILANSYVLTLDTKDLNYEKANVLETRIAEFENAFQYYELPYRIFYSLYFDGTNNQRSRDDLAYINKNFPWIETDKLAQSGEIGLLGGFFKLITTTEDEIEDYLVMYEDDAHPYGPKEEFWNNFNKALVSLPVDRPAIFLLSYTNYCKQQCPNTEGWIKGYMKHAFGAHSIIFTKPAITAILDYAKQKKINLPIDRLFKHLHDVGVITLFTWMGPSSNGGMFCGLFSQKETFCGKRNSIIDHAFLKRNAHNKK
jgi:glycosyltransferase involved in cell wall biosynthesis